MHFKKTLKVIVAGVLVLASMLSMFACKQEQQAAEDGTLPLQWENKVYYFQQGIRTDWTFVQVSADKKMVNQDTGLVCLLAPLASGEVDVEAFEADFTSNKGTAVEGVEYAVYYDKGDGNTFQDSTNAIVEKLKDESSEKYYNNKHYVDNPRDTFMFTTEGETFTAQYSKLQFVRIEYTFTRDGEDWKGVMNVVTGGLDYFIVTYEAKADLYSQYEEAYLELIGDFRKEGWEVA